jgi:dTDP-4-dehydrorhamnose reductase
VGVDQLASNVSFSVKIVVTGANGMLGNTLCRLFTLDHEVYAFHRDARSYTDCSAEYRLDLLEENKVERLFDQLAPDLVIHCAGLVDIDACERGADQALAANVVATENLARFCPHDVPLVYISTDQVYGDDANRSEGVVDLHPVNIYGQTKLQAEQVIRKSRLNHIVIRTNIFGWNIKPGKISAAERLYRSLRAGEAITLFTDYLFSPIYSNVLGEIILQLVARKFRGTLNVGSLRPCSKYQFGRSLAKIFGLDSSLISAGSIGDHVFTAKRPGCLSLNVDKASQMGIELPTYQISLERFRQDNYC